MAGDGDEAVLFVESGRRLVDGIDDHQHAVAAPLAATALRSASASTRATPSAVYCEPCEQHHPTG